MFFILLVNSITEAKITIFAHYFGQPEFIKYQYELFKKNILDDYELIVVEDSNDALISEQIRNECEKYNIQYIHIPRSIFETPKLHIMDEYVGIHNPSFECCVAVQHIYDNYVVHSKNICMIIDNDIFLVSPFSVEEYSKSYSFSYIHQQIGTVNYMLPNFLILDPSRMPQKECLNFNMGNISGYNTDSGGYTHFYLNDHNTFGKVMPVHFLSNTDSLLKEKFKNACPLLFTSKKWGSHYFINKDLFLHLRMGSNWSNSNDYPQMKTETTFLLDQLLYDKNDLDNSSNKSLINI